MDMAAMAALSGDHRPPGRNAPIPFPLSSFNKSKPQSPDLSSLALAADVKTRALAARDPNVRPIHPFATARSAGSNNERSWPAITDTITVELDIWSPTDCCAPSPATFGPPCQADDTMQLDTPNIPHTRIKFPSRVNPQCANSFSVFQDNCRYEHPRANGSASANPFSVLSGNSNNNINNNRGGFGRQQAAQPNQFSLSKDTIQKDLTEERPSWILSAYGPGRDAPEQLWGGYPIEQSFEEMRLHYMMGEASGNAQGALTEIQGLWGQAQGKLQSALGNLDGAIDFILQSQNTHPNRHDVCQANSSTSTGEFSKSPVGLQPSQPANAFSAPPAGGAFGQPSALGQSANPFSTAAAGASGSSPFAQTAAPAQPSAFGQPSALGGGTSAFGQPSTLGGGSAFGQPSALGGGSAFGKPSALGQTGGTGFAQTGGTGFGQTAGTGFGQTSAMGQSTNPFGAPSFGQPAQPSQPGPSAGGFGQPSQLGAKPNPFSTGGTAASASPFGAMGRANSNPNPFATNTQSAQPGPATSSSPFGQPAQQSATPEVSMDASGPPAAQNPFAQASNPSAAPANPFGQPAQPAASNPFAQAAPASNGFAAAARQPAGATPGGANPYPPNATRQHPPYESYARKAPTGQLLTFKGKEVTYKMVEEKGEAPKPVPGIQNFDGSWTKIWFPDGPPPYYKDTEPDRAYTDGEKAAYEQFVSTGRFTLEAAGGGGMPEAAPMREYCTWDL
ncbi:hypothetical protein J7T55_009657 [Diaporthe amygdali]|uniref:uncharacterized protein n=1 Tax=Phomopsis amygdali TaxID=1214568 RepID=UPI0022FDBA2A|nr:uncharacterized protein J7T55_009657 [Diaporthe amygdali]KAJ0103993.1 hypothetical protein J7T55_009657 [Diaporthe amygdali]